MLHGAGIFTYISHQTLPKCSEIFHNWSIWVREVSRMMNCNTLAVQQYTEHAMLWGPAACWPMCACVKSCHYGLSEVCSLLARLPTIPCVKTVLQQFLHLFSVPSSAIHIFLCFLLSHVNLVGSFNPPEKYESQIGSSSQLLGKIKIFTSNQIVINHN